MSIPTVLLLLLALLYATALAPAQEQPKANELKELRQHFQWLSTIGAKELDADENDRFCTRMAKGAANHLPAEALSHLDRTFRLLSPGAESEDSVDVLMVATIISTFLSENPDTYLKWAKEDPKRADIMRLNEGDLSRLFTEAAPAYFLDKVISDPGSINATYSPHLHYRGSLVTAMRKLASEDWKAAVSRLQGLKPIQNRTQGQLVEAIAKELDADEYPQAIAWMKTHAPDNVASLEQESIGARDPKESLTKMMGAFPKNLTVSTES